jgi:uncharacterized membrane protein HdeD (DUF308 family)
MELFGVSADELRRHTGRAKWFGILLLVLGLIAMVVPVAFTIVFELFVGALLLLGGMLLTAAALAARGVGGRAVPLLLGLTGVIVGALFLINPFEGAKVLTVILALFFLLGGGLRIAAGSLGRALPGSGWAIVSGVFGVLIAVLVLVGWPSSSLWFIGLLIGIDLLFLGVALLAAASAVRRGLGDNP